MNVSPSAVLAHLVALVALPVLLTGVVRRTMALIAGRRGPGLTQLYFDLVRLAKKEAVVSAVASPLFRFAPLVVLSTSIVASALVPLAGTAPVSFPYDFIAFAYLLGLQRLFLVAAALDTGSPFEGMGAAREATFGALVEPAFFLVAATLAVTSGKLSFADMVQHAHGEGRLVVVVACVAALFIMLLVEAGRVPVDDPQTHLELTMVHEVMVLDHSGPELAMLEAAEALKLAIFASLVAALASPFDIESPTLALGAHAILVVAVAITIGVVESLVARIRLSFVPRYVLAAALAGLTALLVTTGIAGLLRVWP